MPVDGKLRVGDTRSCYTDHSLLNIQRDGALLTKMTFSDVLSIKGLFGKMAWSICHVVFWKVLTFLRTYGKNLICSERVRT